MAPRAADSERFEREYDAVMARWPAELRVAWDALKASVDAAFVARRRFWRSGGYFVQGRRNFLALEPKRDRVEVRVHVDPEHLQRVQGVPIEDRSHSARFHPRVQAFQVTRRDDVEVVMVAARLAEHLMTAETVPEG